VRRTPLLALGLASCAAPVDDRELYVQAQDPARDPVGALALCRAMQEPDESDACSLALVRSGRALPAGSCAALRGADGRAECWFLLGEQLAEAGDRWGALEACGRAARFTNECLYHAWTRELQAVAREAPDLPAALVAAEDPIAYWSQLETAGPAQPERVWGDFWTFWWQHHPPASLQACAGLPTPSVVASCERGTRLFVERSVDQALRDPDQANLLDRSCRSGELPDRLLAMASPEPELAAAGARALTRLCDEGTAAPRPWNPVFQPRRTR
jgi:hypothetical protein